MRYAFDFIVLNGRQRIIANSNWADSDSVSATATARLTSSFPPCQWLSASETSLRILIGGVLHWHS